MNETRENETVMDDRLGMNEMTSSDHDPVEGSEPGGDQPPRTRKQEVTTLLQRHEGGYAAHGPGFYVWDRDPAEVIRVAESLLEGCFTGSRTARFLLIGEEELLTAC
jgi:hypothetical protein